MNPSQIAIGGEWFLKKRERDENRLLLVAGGVGINPILSMLRHLVAESDNWSEIELIYTACNWEEILYKKEVLELMKKLPHLNITVVLTQQNEENLPEDIDRVTFSRKRLSRETFERFDSRETVAYLCGPPGLSDQINSWMKKTSVNYEKWW